ncbi:MAG: TolC family protein [Thiobacillus sp.]|nr:TolC family protein [Thiobacillus sp.]
MRASLWCVVLTYAMSASASAAPLTLEEALATVSAPHPDRRIAESDLALARADREQVGSRQDFNLYLEGALRSGRRPDGDWKPDNIARIVARKPLYDFGRTDQAIAAADQEVVARQAALFNVQNLRRIDIMARYFDALLADMQYAADNELMAVTYIAFDNARKRFEVGQISQPELLRLEATFQDVRERRNAALQRMSSARQKLAHAMNRPGELPSELADPVLKDNARAVPEYDALAAWAMQKNPRILAAQAQLNAVDARVASLRAENRPTLDAEVVGGNYSRASTTRDELSAGLVVNIPLYQGGRVDARVAREHAQKERLAAELEKLKRDLSETLYTTLDEVNWLRDSARPAADKQIEFRDWMLERARAEYELELKTNLGASMADTQLALLRRKQVEFRLALALARLEALSGGSLPPVEGAKQ